MAIRRYYPAVTKPLPFSTATFPERVQEDKWHFTHPQTTSRLRSRPHLTPYYFKPEGFSAVSFAERVQLDKWDAPTLKLLPIRWRTQVYSYPYIGFDNDFPQVPRPDAWDGRYSRWDTYRPKRATPHLYQFLFDNDFPQVPSVAAFGGNTTQVMPRSRNRIAHLLPGGGFVGVSTVHTLLLLGVG